MDQELLGKLLIASPGLEDIRFQDSVILICEHSKDATMGLILNKPLYNFNTSQFLKKMKINSINNFKSSPTFFGGPVHLNQGFIVHSNEKKYKTSFFSNKKDLVGRKLKINLKMGQILHPRHLFESFEINNGDIISIVSNSGNVSVIVSGEAQDSGNLGDLIKVKNLKSGKIVKGYIKKDKKIKIFR